MAFSFCANDALCPSTRSMPRFANVCRRSDCNSTSKHALRGSLWGDDRSMGSEWVVYEPNLASVLKFDSQITTLQFPIKVIAVIHQNGAMHNTARVCFIRLSPFWKESISRAKSPRQSGTCSLDSPSSQTQMMPFGWCHRDPTRSIMRWSQRNVCNKIQESTNPARAFA